MIVHVIQYIHCIYNSYNDCFYLFLISVLVFRMYSQLRHRYRYFNRQISALVYVSFSLKSEKLSDQEMFICLPDFSVEECKFNWHCCCSVSRPGSKPRFLEYTLKNSTYAFLCGCFFFFKNVCHYFLVVNYSNSINSNRICFPFLLPNIIS